MKVKTILTVLQLIILLSMDNSFPQAGMIDSSFGQNGIVTTAFNVSTNSRLTSTSVQSDGKIVTAGSMEIDGQDDFAITRFNPDGSLDNSFGLNGVVVTSMGTENDCANSIAVQSDGKIVAAGVTNSGVNSDFVLVRYNQDGSPDASFGTSGFVITSLGSGEVFQTLALQADGKIVAAGYSRETIGNNDIALVRYNINGTLDNTFGTGGIVIIPTSSSEQIHSIKIQEDGKILAAGYSDFAGSNDIMLARFNTDGTFDNTFGTNGIVITVSGTSDEEAISVELQNDGKIIAAGFSTFGGTSDLAVLRYNLDGTLDNTFGINGVVICFYASGDERASDVEIQSDGKLVITGSTMFSSDGSIVLIRLNPNGNLDNTFGYYGFVITDIGPSLEGAVSVIIQDDNKIIAAGASYIAFYGSYLLLRYHPNGVLDMTFGENGIINTPIGTFYNEANASVIQNEDNILAAGGCISEAGNSDFIFTRYNTNGELDYSFGVNGKKIISFGTSDDEAKSLVLQSDGKIVAAGVSGSDLDFALVRLTADGVIDNGFGASGKVVTDIGANDEARSVLIQNDGKIIAAGYAYTGGMNDFALVRYNADGSLDNSFGSGGIVTTLLGMNNDEINAAVIQNDGKIIAAGSHENGSNKDFALVRYNSDGTPDNTFGINGIVITHTGTSDNEIYSIKLLDNGKILAAGYSKDGAVKKSCLARYNADGTLDNSFGTAGIVITQIGASHSSFTTISIQDNGRIAAAGQAYDVSGRMNITLVRYEPDGNIDISFGTNGIVITSVGISNSAAYSTLIQSDGKIILTGCSSLYAGTHNNCLFTLARYYGDPPVDVKIENGNNIPSAFKLDQNYPNPFNPTTNINFSIPYSEFVSLKIFDVLGNEAAVLVNEFINAGTYRVRFTADKLSSGVYFCILKTGNFTDTKKIILIK